MPLDPTKHLDWEIAEEAEKNMATIYEVGERLGLTKDELLSLKEYVQKGGNLLVTGDALLYDQIGERRRDFSLTSRLPRTRPCSGRPGSSKTTYKKWLTM